MDKEGARLTTFQFTSPSGGVFSYTVENNSEPRGGVEEMEAWEAEEASRDQWKKAAREQVRPKLPRIVIDTTPGGRKCKDRSLFISISQRPLHFRPGVASISSKCKFLSVHGAKKWQPFRDRRAA